MTAVMTGAATVTAEKAAIDRGWAVWRRGWQADRPEKDRKVIGDLLGDLHAALKLHSLILNEETRPASEWPELEHEAEAFDMALAKAAEDVTGWTDELVRVFPAAEEGGGQS